LTSFPETLARTEPGRKQVLDVEDWAEIRRLPRSDGMAITETELFQTTHRPQPGLQTPVIGSLSG
jgi:hypothetical protein